MKIKFLGVGSAFTTSEYYQSNLLITGDDGRKLLLDCGSDARFSLAEQGITGRELKIDIDAIYVSHLHADHVGGLEWFAFSTYFNPAPGKAKLFAEAETMDRLWRHTLLGGIGCISGRKMELEDYFDLLPQAADGTFDWGDLRFRLHRMQHVLSPAYPHWSYGLHITPKLPGAERIFISTDAVLREDLLLPVARESDVIFHDCETVPFKSTVHAHYDDLRTLSEDLRARTWLYHYNPNPGQNPEADGFKGFVRKGQEFEF